MDHVSVSRGIRNQHSGFGTYLTCGLPKVPRLARYLVNIDTIFSTCYMAKIALKTSRIGNACLYKLYPNGWAREESVNAERENNLYGIPRCSYQGNPFLAKDDFIAVDAKPAGDEDTGGHAPWKRLSVDTGNVFWPWLAKFFVQLRGRESIDSLREPDKNVAQVEILGEISHMISLGT